MFLNKYLFFNLLAAYLFYAYHGTECHLYNNKMFSREKHFSSMYDGFGYFPLLPVFISLLSLLKTMSIVSSAITVLTLLNMQVMCVY